MSIPDFGAADEVPFAKEMKLVANLKKAILVAAGAAVQKLMMKIEQEQEVLMNLADMAIQTYNAESVLLRVMRMVEQQGENASQHQLDMMRVYLYDAADLVNKAGKDAINSFAEGDEQRMILMGLKRFTKAESFNTKEARRRVADKMIAEGRYCF
jgi:thymidine kinase